jgi:endonuclease/exonuclease/phosphatase family metal-dependent hydrolase
LASSSWQEFNVVTLNAFGVPLGRTRARLLTIARELNDVRLDAVSLQEVQMYYYAPMLGAAFTNFPYVSWEPHLYAPKGGLMTLSRHPQSRARFIPFDARGWFMGPTIADRMLHKGMLICDMECGETPITLINTHLAANYSGNWDRTNRYARLEAEQLRQLARVVNEQPREHIVIVVGDFNIPRYSWLYEEFLESTGLHDPQGTFHEPTYRPNARLPKEVAALLAVAIDHALVRFPDDLEWHHESTIILRDKVRLVDGRHAHLSDHYGIHLRVQWQKKRTHDEPTRNGADEHREENRDEAAQVSRG